MKLKPCPFCGNKIDESDFFQKHYFWYLNCSRCFAVGPQEITKEKAAESWNKRPLEKEDET